MSNPTHPHLDHEPADRSVDAKPRPKRFWTSSAGLVTITFLAIGGFLLVAEHRAHLAPYAGFLPFLLVLACLPMHLFTHGGHEGHGSRNGASSGDDQNAHRH